MTLLLSMWTRKILELHCLRNYYWYSDHVIYILQFYWLNLLLLQVNKSLWIGLFCLPLILLVTWPISFSLIGWICLPNINKENIWIFLLYLSFSVPVTWRSSYHLIGWICCYSWKLRKFQIALFRRPVDFLTEFMTRDLGPSIWFVEFASAKFLRQI